MNIKNDFDKQLYVAVWLKIIDNEPLSLKEFERFIDVLEGASFSVNTPQPPEVAGVQARFVSVLQQRFISPPQQQQS